VIKKALGIPLLDIKITKLSRCEGSLSSALKKERIQLSEKTKQKNKSIITAKLKVH